MADHSTDGLMHRNTVSDKEIEQVKTIANELISKINTRFTKANTSGDAILEQWVENVTLALGDTTNIEYTDWYSELAKRFVYFLESTPAQEELPLVFGKLQEIEIGSENTFRSKEDLP